MTAINIQPVAEICSASHDDAQFGERAIKPLRDISGFEYGTPLYAGAAPAAAEHMQLTEEQWYDLASRHATVDWNGNGFLNAVKTLCADFAGIANRQSAAAAPALEAPAALEVIDIGDDGQLRMDPDIPGAWQLFRGDSHIRYLDKFERNFVNSAIRAALTETARAPAAPSEIDAREQVTRALGLGADGLIPFAWSYLVGQIEQLVECEAELCALKAAPAAPAVDAADSARLDFVLKNDAFIAWTERDGTILQCQLLTQDEDEHYHVISGEHRFFNTAREAIDAARAAQAAAKGAGHD